MAEDISCLFSDIYYYTFNEHEEPSPIRTVVKAILITFSIVGFIGNSLICYVILSNKHMHTTTNYYLFSLAVTDGTEAFTLICSAVYSQVKSYFSSDLLIFFHINNAVYIITSCTSVAVALAFTVDRYIAICHPFVARTFTLSRTTHIIVSLWVVVAVYSSGLAFCGGKAGEFCDKYRFLFSAELYSLLFFLIPMVLNFVLYLLIGIRIFKSSRIFQSINNRNNARSGNTSFMRSLKMSVAVIAECCICWAPMHVFSIMHNHYEPFKIDEKGAVILLAYLLYLLSAVINPVVYCVMSRTFRKSFKNALCSSGGIYRRVTLRSKNQSSTVRETETTNDSLPKIQPKG